MEQFRANDLRFLINFTHDTPSQFIAVSGRHNWRSVRFLFLDKLSVVNGVEDANVVYRMRLLRMSML